MLNEKINIELPLVSVCITTYNQFKYISKCLESCLMQETSFKYEILLGEDDSNDGTRQICIDYSQKYPDKIRLFLSDRKNVIYMNGRPTGRWNFYNLIKNARGKYIAFLDGDDYWNDSLKLQKQVDFLELDKEYGLVHSDFDRLVELTQRKITSYNKRQKYKTTSSNMFEDILIKRIDIKTSTACGLKNLIYECFTKYPELLTTWRMADLPIWLELSRKTKIGYIDESLATYRVLESSACNNFEDREIGLEFHNSYFDVKKYFIEKYGCSDKIRTIVDIQNYKGILTFAFYLNDRKKGLDAYKRLRMLIKPGLVKIEKKLFIYYIGIKYPPIGFLLRVLIWIYHRF